MTSCPYCKSTLQVSAEGIPFCRSHGRFDPLPMRNDRPAVQRTAPAVSPGARLDTLTQEYAKARGISYGLALRAVQLQHPELARAEAERIRLQIGERR